MNATTLRTLAASAAFAAATAAIPAYADIYVAKTGSDANPGTLAAPKLTIQAGVDAVASGGTVYVAPGIYDDFTTDATYGNVCVFITNKVVTLAASGAKAETVILGRRQPGVESGLGNDAVRCVATSGAGGTVISGFTLRNGCTKANARGGGYYDAGAKTDVTIVNCDFQGCASNWGGGAYGGTSVRCRFTGCMATGYGSVLASAKAYNCVLVGNRIVSGCQGVILYNAGMANCTIAFNEGWPVEQPRQNIYNCLMVGNTGWKDHDRIVNCATDAGVGTAVTADDLFSPATGDWRLKTGSAAIGAGDASHVADIPANYRGTDLLGNPRMTGDAVNCGAVEASATPVATGVSFVSCEPRYGLGAVDGAVTGSAVPLPLRAEALPAKPTISFVAADGYGMVALTNTVGNSDIHWPLMDETVPLRIAAATNLTYGPVAGVVCHVAPNGDDTNGDGSAAAPFATIAQGVDGVAGTKLVLVHAGVYAPKPVSYNGMTRLKIAKNSVMVRVKAVDGSAATAIIGASDPTGDGGLGADAARCVTLEGPVSIQGFTLRGGRTLEPTASGNSGRKGGGAFMTDARSSVLDCVFNDCSGTWGGAVAGAGTANGNGHVIRCVFTGCSVAELASYDVSLAYYVDLHACLFHHNAFPSGATISAVAGPGVNARFCTFADNSSSFGTFGPWRWQSGGGNNIVYGTAGGGVDLPWHSTAGVNYYFAYGLFGTSTQDASNYATAVQGKPRFADDRANDYRLQNNSAALAAGSLQFVTDRDLCDVTGRMFDFAASASGSCIAGCYAETVSARNGMIVTFR